MVDLPFLRATLQRAVTKPDELAIAHPSASLNWAEYVDTSSRIAQLFAQHGVQPAQVVAATGFSAVMQTVLIAATWMRAAIPCAPSPAFLSNPTFELDWVVTPVRLPDVAANRQIIIDQRALQSLGRYSANTTPEPWPDVDAVCRLVFSSGTTGRPKAIPFTIRRLGERTRSAHTRWMPEKPFMSLLGVGTVSGFQTFAESLRSGDPYLIGDTAEESLTMLRRYGVRALKSSPAQLAALAPLLEREPNQLPELRIIQSAGSMLPNKLRARLEAATGAAIVNLYGSSEVGTVAIGTPGDSETGLAGTIVDDVDIEIVDDNGQQVAEGMLGNIRVKRAGQPEEYFRDAEATARAFFDGWFMPGDLGMIQGGELYVRGRSSELINAAGVKVSPSDVEQTLLGHPGITDVAVFARSGDTGVMQIEAAIVCDGEIDAVALDAYARKHFGEAAPARYLPVTSIPRNETGKILRELLPSSTDGVTPLGS